MNGGPVPRPITHGCEEANSAEGRQCRIASSGKSKTRRQPGSKGLHRANRGQKAIPASRDGLDKSGIIGGIPHSIAYLLDCVVQPLIKGDINIRGPDSLAQLLPCNHLTWALNQECKNAKWLVLQLDLHALFTEFARLWVELKHAEPDNLTKRTRRF